MSTSTDSGRKINERRPVAVGHRFTGEGRQDERVRRLVVTLYAADGDFAEHAAELIEDEVLEDAFTVAGDVVELDGDAVPVRVTGDPYWRTVALDATSLGVSVLTPAEARALAGALLAAADDADALDGAQ